MEGYILEKFVTIKNIWDGFLVFSQETIYHMCTEIRQSLASFTAMPFFFFFCCRKFLQNSWQWNCLNFFFLLICLMVWCIFAFRKTSMKLKNARRNKPGFRQQFKWPGPMGAKQLGSQWDFILGSVLKGSATSHTHIPHNIVTVSCNNNIPMSVQNNVSTTQCQYNTMSVQYLLL